MKIAVLCNYELRPDRIGGMDYFFWQFDAAVKKAGHTIHWYFPNEASHGEYSSLNIYAANHTTVEAFFLKERTVEYNIVYCHFLELCTSFFKQLKRNNHHTRIIAVDHNPRPIGGYPLKKRIEKKLKGWLYSKYIDVFVGVSVYTVNEMLKDFGNHLTSKSYIIYNGILTHSIQRRNHRSTSAPSFLTACHLRYSKGIQDLIQAVDLLPENIKQTIHIDVYGDGDYRETLQQMTLKANLESQFSFKGNAPDLGNIYHKYDYLLHPSHMECFSLGLLESLAANVPVITTTVGGNTEVVTDGTNGYLIEPANTQQLASVIEDLYTGKKTITIDTDTLVKKEFTLEKMVTGYLALLS
ncbi:MAG: glycosyltransferase family 4 protein [Bacteroidota bacterium]